MMRIIVNKSNKWLEATLFPFLYKKKLEPLYFTNKWVIAQLLWAHYLNTTKPQSPCFSRESTYPGLEMEVLKFLPRAWKSKLENQRIRNVLIHGQAGMTLLVRTHMDKGAPILMLLDVTQSCCQHLHWSKKYNILFPASSYHMLF